MARKSTIAYNRSRGAFTNKRGTIFKGVCRPRGRNRKCSLFRGRAGLVAGARTDANITAHVNLNAPLDPDSASIIECIQANGITVVKKQAQVPVHDSRTRTATRIDLLCRRGAREPFVVEVKTTNMSSVAHAASYKTKIDPVTPTYKLDLTSDIVEHTVYAEHYNQLTKTMALFARTKRMRPGRVLHGAIVMHCRADSTTVFYPVSITVKA